ncbi:MAG: class I SAM-dependent methyltransferase family protein [Thaumarchaeota archaeon]|nr:class I SAM-dependent methyltransferase family protein [Nitrososphaerota archaeon]
MLKQALAGLLSQGELNELYSGFDIVGDIALIKIPDSLQAKRKLIGQTILQKIKPVKVVLMQSGPVSGEYRIRELEHIAGEDRTSTIYKEHSCTFLVDVAKAYFSPRLSTERLRISKLVKEGERVLNMFAGVGIYSIIIAKVQPKCGTVSIEINPDAHKSAIENAMINKVSQRVTAILGDAKEVIKNGGIGKFDRVLMPLPESAFEYLENAISALKASGGWIHYYSHTHALNNEGAIINSEKDLLERLQGRGKIKFTKVVREVGPKWFQVVTDIQF